MKSLLSRSKKAAVEWYSWFMLFATMALLITALVAFVVKHGAVPYESLGEAAIASQNLIFKKEMQLRQIDTVVESSANIAARELSYTFGVTSKDQGYTYYNGVPILMIDGVLQNVPDLQYKFPDTFITILKAAGSSVRDPERVLFFSMDAFYVLDYNTNSVSLIDGNKIYGFSLKRKTLTHNVKTGIIELKYFPDFKYYFQNYSFSEYQGILKNVSTELKNMLTENKCDLTMTQIELNFHNNKKSLIPGFERYNVFLNNDCTKMLNNDYTFSEYYVPDITAYRFINPSEDNCQIFVCVQDNQRLLSGITHGGYFKVGNPIYRFALTQKFP